MEPNAEEDRFSDDEHQRPPSSYGSMRSSVDLEEDCRSPEEEGADGEKNQDDQEVDELFSRPEPALPQAGGAYEEPGVQMNRPDYPETLYTMTTMQTKPPGALVIDTGGSDRLSDIKQSSVSEEEDDEYLITNSPEPPEAIEMEEEEKVDIHGQPGIMHPEQEMPHVFRNIQKALSELKKEDFSKFKANFHLQLFLESSSKELFEGDLLDFVDRIIEKFGLERSLSGTLITLKHISKENEAEALRASCKKAMLRFILGNAIIRNYEYLFDMVPVAGERQHVDNIYVEPQICLGTCTGMDSSHEFRNFPHTLQSPHPDSVVSLKNVMRLRKADGELVRTVVTAGIPGGGRTMSVAKYCYDWAKERYNKELQYVITLPFDSLWKLRNQNISSKKEMSIMDVIEYNHLLCKSKTYLDDKDCKFLLIMDCFDCYQKPLDWKNTPVITDSKASAQVLDHLIVNLIRGSLLPNAQIWILGRQAAVSQIPSEFIDAFTEIPVFNNERKEEYIRRHSDSEELTNQIIQRSRLLPTLSTLIQHPFICWMMHQSFSFHFERTEDYGIDPPRLTHYYVKTLIVQFNRRLEFYFDQPRQSSSWSKDHQTMLGSLSCMALKMLERNTFEFGLEQLTVNGLDAMDVTVFSGLCIELPPASSGQRRFCFLHPTFVEFLAALYVHYLFGTESKNALASIKSFKGWATARSWPDIVQSVIKLTLQSPFGQYDMFLRFVCGLGNPEYRPALEGRVYERSRRLDFMACNKKVSALLKKTIETCPAERKPNMEECLREMTQKIS